MNISANALSWVLIAALIVTLVLNALGIVNLRLENQGEPNANAMGYVDAAERLQGADRSQPLHAQLESQFPGPLQDTTIQRWRDPVDGTVCYIYLPIAVAHAQGPAGLVQYGAANIGSISCFPTQPQR